MPSTPKRAAGKSSGAIAAMMWVEYAESALYDVVCVLHVCYVC